MHDENDDFGDWAIDTNSSSCDESSENDESDKENLVHDKKGKRTTVPVKEDIIKLFTNKF